MKAVKETDLMAAKRTRLPSTATCSDKYYNRKLTKDCVIWRVIMNHKDRYAKREGESKKHRSSQKNKQN